MGVLPFHLHTRRTSPEPIARFDRTSTYVHSPVERLPVTDEEPPAGWERERLPGGVDADRRPDFVAYRHDSGDVRVRVAPPKPALDRTAHVLSLTLFPGTELAESRDVREVASEARATELAVQLMKLFNGAYDGPATVEDAAQFALERTSPPDAVLDSLVNGDE